MICYLATCSAPFTAGQNSIYNLSVSEQACPPREIWVQARDGHKAVAVLRKPPGKGRFPAIVILHGTMSSFTVSDLEGFSRRPTPSRFLAAGYVIVLPTFRSRRQDPQAQPALWDALAVTDYLKRLPEVDRNSVVLYGCSAGGSLALEVAGRTRVSAVGAEDPATFLFTGMLTKHTPRKGPEFGGRDAVPLLENPELYFSPGLRALTREKIQRITAPVLILEGDTTPPADRLGFLDKFNKAYFLPALRAARKEAEVISYPGEPHCFGIWGDQRPSAAAKLFADVNAFFQRHLRTQPVPVEESLVSQVPASSQ